MSVYASGMEICTFGQIDAKLANTSQTRFHGDNMGSNPIGDTKHYQQVNEDCGNQLVSVGNAVVTIEQELSPFSLFSASSGDSAYAPSKSFTASERKAGLRCWYLAAILKSLCPRMSATV